MPHVLVYVCSHHRLYPGMKARHTVGIHALDFFSRSNNERILFVYAAFSFQVHL